MKIIDAHVHFQPASRSLANTARQLSKVDFSAAGLAESMKNSDVEKIVLIGLRDIGSGVYAVLDKEAKNPMLPTMPAGLEAKVFPVAGINPHEASIEAVKTAIKSCKLKGFKVWLGYYHFAANDKIYNKFYELAERHGLPVIFHTGDTYSKVAKLRYSQPLQIDDVAVDFPKMKIIMAHIGNPDVMGAAQVLYKNDNVFADLSGLIVGGREKFGTREVERAKERIAECLDFVENPEKFMFGSDWPIVDQGAYLAFVRQAIPVEHHDAVFYANAKQVFGL